VHHQTAIPTASIPVRWHRFRLAETDASDHASAACYRLPENVWVFVGAVVTGLFAVETKGRVLEDVSP
jgi:hypothetical protein